MGFRIVYGALLLAASVSGCYIDDMAHAPKAPRVSTTGLAMDDDPLTCNFAAGKGCFDGFVGPKKQFYVDGKQFFNADDLATRFAELINVSSQGKAVAPGQGGYQLTLITPVDNASFMQGFDYDMGGPTHRTGKLRTDGGFSVDDLHPGTYDLRISRGIKFTLATAPAKPDQPNQPNGPNGPNGPAAQPTTKTYCATLYFDTTEIVRAQRAYDDFDNFKLYVTDNECAPSGDNTTLTL
jgi:hypothetical protein